MKTLALVMLFGAFLFSGCSETKDTTETSGNEVKKETSQTEEMNSISGDEIQMKEKAGEEPKTEVKETKSNEVKNKDAKLETASFKCSTMTCTGCEQTITGKVKKIDGVQNVKADYKTQSVEVTFASGKVTKDDIAKTIEASGYKCEVNN